MSRPVFNPGHYTHASGFEFQQDNFESEVRVRSLAVIDSYGVISGFGFTDASSPGNPSLRINRGLAFDGSGGLIRITQAQAVAGITTVTGLTTSDINKIIVVENVASGIDFEAHPETTVLSPTKYIDVPTFSVVVSGSVDTTKHVRVARIFLVTEGAGAAVGATTSNGRDTMSFPASTPFVVVGPADDPVADFTGDDATPFNDAVGTLTTNNGGVIVVRPGTYTIDPNDPILTDGLATVQFIGFGQGVDIVSNGGASPHWTISNCGEVSIEGFNFTNTTDAAIEVEDTSRFTFTRNRILGSGIAYRGLNFSSGVTFATIQDNLISGGDIPHISFLAKGAGGVKHLSIVNNRFKGSSFYANEEVENLIFTGNTTRNFYCALGRQFSYGALVLSSPKRVIVSNNVFDGPQGSLGMIRSAASGVIINANQFVLDQDSLAIEFTTIPGGSGANDCVVANNVFNKTVATDVQTIILTGGARGVYRGNTFVYPTGGHSQSAIFLGIGANNIFDQNIFLGFTTPLLDLGLNTFYTVGSDNTSNKEL